MMRVRGTTCRVMAGVVAAGVVSVVGAGGTAAASDRVEAEQVEAM